LNAPVFDTPEDAEHAFYRAFEKADLEAMMATWADADDVVCIHPGGNRLVGPTDVRESWRRIFAGGVKLTFRVAERTLVECSELRVHNVLEEISVGGGPRIVARVFVTNIYVRTASGWRMWMHHGSNPSGEAEAEPDRGTAQTLH
jgi:ketosteroid isomerase-like protein